MTTVFWFKRDLRLTDNHGLTAAAKNGRVLPVYIIDEYDNSLGAASKWWLYQSLMKLNRSLEGCLNVYVGNHKEVIGRLVLEHSVKTVYWNRCYEPERLENSAEVKKYLKIELGIQVESFKGSLLWEPWEISKSDGGNYKVYTSFYHNCLTKASDIRPPLPKPDKLSLIKDYHNNFNIEQWLTKASWHEKLYKHWEVGEGAAHKKLEKFLDQNLLGYKYGRDYPAKPNVSKLSPHIHFGEISPAQIWWGTHSKMVFTEIENDASHFLKEIIWREFAYHLLFYFPRLSNQNFQSKFDRFPWHYDEGLLAAWKAGKTGYPFVDAGMRELWQTGYMHNRVRMVTASFLVKNMLLNWQYGEEWFRDCLVDADLANNSAGWQWVAGSGADAAPYFRIFNPTLQGEKLDPEGEYTRRFIPELSKMPSEYLFKPWQAPKDVLKSAGVVLGQTYPVPIIDLKTSRMKALQAYNCL